MLSNNMRRVVSPRLADALSDFFYISRQIISIKLIRSKSLILGSPLIFNVINTHKSITFQGIYMDKIPPDLTSSKDNDYVALNNLLIIG